MTRGTAFSRRAALSAGAAGFVALVAPNAGHAVEPLDPLPAQEDVRRRLHQTLARHHSLAVMRVLALAQKSFEA